MKAVKKVIHIPLVKMNFEVSLKNYKSYCPSRM